MKYSKKILVYTTASILAVSIGTALDVNSSQALNYFNDGQLQFQVDTSGNIQSYGNLDLGGNQLQSFFGGACPSGQTVVDVNNDGTFQCMDVSNEVSGDYVSRSGDSMTGSLDMNGNNLNGVDQISSSVDGNDFWKLSDGSGGSNNAPYTMRFDTRDWRLWAGDTGQAVMQLSQDGTVEIPSGDLSLSGTLTSGTVPTARLDNDAVTVNSGSHLTGGGSVALGGSTSLSVDAGSMSWSDLGISQNDISTSNLGAANSNLNMNGNSITNYYGSACPSGQTVVDVNDDGSFQCMDVSGEVSNDYVNRNGDSMTGNLDMSGNNVNNINKIQLNNIESVSDGQIGRDNSIGYLGNWGGNGNAVLWDSYNVQAGNAISVSGGTGPESNPQISVNEGSISHDNIGGVSYNDHHGLGNALTWDSNNNPAVSSGGIGSNEISSGAISTTELNTGNVDGRYVNRNGDTMSGSLTVNSNIVFGSNNWGRLQDGSGFESFSSEHGNDVVIRNMQGSTNQHIFLGDTSSGTSQTILGVGQGTNKIIDLKANGNLDLTGNLDVSGNTITNADVQATNGLRLPTGTDAW